MIKKMSYDESINTEYLEFKDGGSTRTLANLSRSSANCSVSVTVSGAEVNDGINALSIGSTATITATADTGYSLTSLKVNGEAFTSGSELTVSGDVVIEAVAEAAPEPSAE